MGGPLAARSWVEQNV